MLKPSPVPPNGAPSRRLACEKGWKSFACTSFDMPIPVSSTVKTTFPRRRVRSFSSAVMLDRAAAT